MRFTVPFLIANVLHTLYSIVDMYIVGQFADATQLSAVATSSGIMMLGNGLVMVDNGDSESVTVTVDGAVVYDMLKKGEDREALWPDVRRRLTAFVRKAGEKGLPVGCEDFDSADVSVGSQAHLRRALAEIPGLEHVLDTGNYTFWKDDVLSALAEFRPRIGHVHVKDLDRADPRWKDFYANGSPETADALADLPRDIVICDWYYGKTFEWGGVSAPGDYPSLAHFAALGFRTVTCPWEDAKGAEAQIAWSIGHGLFGALATTWNRNAGHFRYREYKAADAMWGYPKGFDPFVFATHWRQTGWDTPGIAGYADYGYFPDQVGTTIGNQ